MSKTFIDDDLRGKAATLLIASGSSREEAETVANNLVMANLSGHDSHGVGMLPRYVDAVLEGGLIPNAPVATLLDIGTMLALNGQRSYGQVVGAQAMQLAMTRAKTHGSCIMTLANTHHLGRIGQFAEMATAEGLVSIHFVNVISRPMVAPWGGTDGRFGTNPFCIGIPINGQDAFIFDIATSGVAQGKMRVAYNEGRPVKPGLLIDEQGNPTTNPGVVVVPQPNGLLGALLPFGEHKGYGLAVACELLGGALTGGGTWHQEATKENTSNRAVSNSMLTILIDPARLGTQATFDHEAAAFVDWLKQSPAATGFDAVQIAGDYERLTRLKREKDGINIDPHTWEEIVAAGKKVGITLGEEPERNTP